MPPVTRTVPSGSQAVPGGAGGRGVRAPAEAAARTPPSRRASLGFAGGERPAGQPACGGEVGRSVEVDEDEPAGVLGLGGADQAPDRGGGQVGDVLGVPVATAPRVRTTRRVAGEPLVGEPVLHAGRGPAPACAWAAAGAVAGVGLRAGRRSDDGRCRVARVQRGGEGGQVRWVSARADGRRARRPPVVGADRVHGRWRGSRRQAAQESSRR